MKKLDFIDALRGYAILGVLMVHTSQYGNKLHSTLGTLITEKGAMGVQLFFLASSFTLFLSEDFLGLHQFFTSLFVITCFKTGIVSAMFLPPVHHMGLT